MKLRHYPHEKAICCFGILMESTTCALVLGEKKYSEMHLNGLSFNFWS